MENTAALTLTTTEKKTRAKRTVKAIEIMPSSSPAIEALTDNLRTMYIEDIADRVNDLTEKGERDVLNPVSGMVHSISCVLLSISSVEQFITFRDTLLTHAKNLVSEARSNS